MRNAEKIGRDDWIRTSDPLNPIPQWNSRVSGGSIWGSSTNEWLKEANQDAEPAPRWPVFLPIVLVLAVLAIFLQWTLFGWASRVFEHATRAMAGPWA